MGLDTVEILMRVEKDFVVSVPDRVASDCVTVGDLQRAVVDLLVARGRERSPELEEEVWNGLVTIVTEQMGMRRDEVRPASRWVGDITKYG